MSAAPTIGNRTEGLLALVACLTACAPTPQQPRAELAIGFGAGQSVVEEFERGQTRAIRFGIVEGAYRGQSGLNFGGHYAAAMAQVVATSGSDDRLGRPQFGYQSLGGWAGASGRLVGWELGLNAYGSYKFAAPYLAATFGSRDLGWVEFRVLNKRGIADSAALTVTGHARWRTVHAALGVGTYEHGGPEYHADSPELPAHSLNWRWSTIAEFEMPLLGAQLQIDYQLGDVGELRLWGNYFSAPTIGLSFAAFLPLGGK